MDGGPVIGKRDAAEGGRVAFLWDKSFLWGLIAYDTFRHLRVHFDLLTSADVGAGGLEGYDVLFVPGGWASDKIVSLGAEGRRHIRDFVQAGGSYLGICGGAGLALSHENGLALAAIGRTPAAARLPSFSGPIRLEPAAADHPMWTGLSGGGHFHAWWPGQFSLDDNGDVQVLARYGAPGEGSYVTDLPALAAMDWEFWEKRYGINLNPQRIAGGPAVIETRFGLGKVLLSYLHFETPGDPAGHRVLLNILAYLAGGKQVAGAAPSACRAPVRASSAGRPAAAPGTAGPETTSGSALLNEMMEITRQLRRSADDLIEFGKKNGLWVQRNDWVLRWRRGIRGVEYSTLYAMLARLDGVARRLAADAACQADEPVKGVAENIRRLRDISRPFFEDAPALLLLERDALGRGPLSPLETDDERIRTLRERMFSHSKRYGGLFGQIIALADEALLPLLRRQAAGSHDRY